MKNKKLLKWITTGVLSLGIVAATIGMLTGCHQTQTNPHETTPAQTTIATELPTEEITEAPTAGNTETPTEPVKETRDVEEIVDAYIKEKSYYETQFDSALIDLMAEKCDINEVEEIELKNFVGDKNGTIQITVTYENGATEDFVYSGDTTKYETLYSLATDPVSYVENLLEDLGVNSYEVEVGSALEMTIQDALANANAEFDTGLSTFESIAPEEIVSTKPIEYVTVQEIVDEVFADVDFDANIKDTIQTLFTKRVAETIKLDKILSFDYEIGEEGKIVYYCESISSTTGASQLSSQIVNADTTQLQTYLSMSGNFDKYISQRLEEKGFELNSTIEKESRNETQLRAELDAIKSDYLTQKQSLDSTEKKSIKLAGLFNPITFSEEKMAELGIEDYNAFAKMLLTNENTEGLDQVTGWTMDDVLATYVSDFSPESINYTSGVNMLVLTKDGIMDYRVWTRRSYGDSTDRYSMLLNDNENTGLTSIENKAVYSENAVVYDAEGNRVNNNDLYIESTYLK